MFSSVNENVGFSAIEQEELEEVNGGICPVGIGGILLGTAIIVASSSKSK